MDSARELYSSTSTGPLVSASFVNSSDSGASVIQGAEESLQVENGENVESGENAENDGKAENEENPTQMEDDTRTMQTRESSDLPTVTSTNENSEGMSDVFPNCVYS